MGEVLSGCAVRAAIQIEGDKFMKVDGRELVNCSYCGKVPQVERLPDEGLRIGCQSAEPDPHKLFVESTPSEWAIDLWNTLNGGRT